MITSIPRSRVTSSTARATVAKNGFETSSMTRPIVSRLMPALQARRHLVAPEPELPGRREDPLGGLGSDARLAVDDARDGLEADPGDARHVAHRRPTRRLPGRLGAARRSVGGRLGAGSSRVVRPALGVPGFFGTAHVVRSRRAPRGARSRPSVGTMRRASGRRTRHRGARKCDAVRLVHGSGGRTRHRAGRRRSDRQPLTTVSSGPHHATHRQRCHRSAGRGRSGTTRTAMARSVGTLAGSQPGQQMIAPGAASLVHRDGGSDVQDSQSRGDRRARCRAPRDSRDRERRGPERRAHGGARRRLYARHHGQDRVHAQAADRVPLPQRGHPVLHRGRRGGRLRGPRPVGRERRAEPGRRRPRTSSPRASTPSSSSRSTSTSPARSRRWPTAAGIPLASYDDMILNAPHAAFIGRDPKEGGRSAAPRRRWRPRRRATTRSSAAIPGQTGSTQFQEGYHEVLDPLVAAGDVTIVLDYFTPGWKTEPAQAAAENTLTANANDVAAFLVDLRRHVRRRPERRRAGRPRAGLHPDHRPGRGAAGGPGDRRGSHVRQRLAGARRDGQGAAPRSPSRSPTCEPFEYARTIDNGAGEIPFVETPIYLVSEGGDGRLRLPDSPGGTRIDDVYANVPDEKPDLLGRVRPDARARGPTRVGDPRTDGAPPALRRARRRAPPVLATRGLTKRFPGVARRRRRSTSRSRAGEIVALLGPNGAGKSTLIQVVGGRPSGRAPTRATWPSTALPTGRPAWRTPSAPASCSSRRRSTSSRT